MTKNILSKKLATRRKVLKFGAAASALPWVHIRTAGAAGQVSVFFWDHWVPAGNVEIRKQVAAFAEKNKVEVIDGWAKLAGGKDGARKLTVEKDGKKWRKMLPLRQRPGIRDDGARGASSAEGASA